MAVGEYFSWERGYVLLRMTLVIEISLINLRHSCVEHSKWVILLGKKKKRAMCVNDAHRG
jgi:hypothetical protein